MDKQDQRVLTHYHFKTDHEFDVKETNISDVYRLKLQ